MRRGFLLAMLGLGASVSLLLILISPRGGTTLTDRPPATASGDGSQTLEAQAFKETNFAESTDLPPARPPVVARAKEITTRNEEPLIDGHGEQDEARVAARIAELENLSTKADRASVETLLSEIKNPNQEIRQAALEAISQSGNRAAIPGLREVAAQTQDSREKQAILDAIEFMSLPTLTELLNGRGATNNRGPAQDKP